MKKQLLVATLVVLGLVASGTTWWISRRGNPPSDLILYGNADLRQVELAFNNSQRIASVLVQEGDHVSRREVLARLDTGCLWPQVREAEARVAAQYQIVEKLHHGSRPDEIAQARANVESAKADDLNARAQCERRVTLAQNSAIGQQDLDNALAALDVADTKLSVNRQALDLAIAGPRAEDIGEAELQADEAQLAFLRQELANAQLIAPINAVVRAPHGAGRGNALNGS